MPGEKFFEPVRGVIDLLKIKASYGIVGNDKIGTGDNVRRFIYNGTVRLSVPTTVCCKIRSPNSSRPLAMYCGGVLVRARWL